MDISALAIQRDGRIVFAGVIESSEPEVTLGRLNDDGSTDASFIESSIPNARLFSLAVDGTERILVGGTFTNIAGQSRYGIARLGPDGALDATFHPLLGADAEVLTMMVQPDGRILIGGRFTTVNGINRRCIARLNEDGSLDDSFNPGMGAGPEETNEVRTVVLLPGGKLLVAGAFTSFNGANRSRITRLNADGSLDLNFDPGAGPNDTISALAVQPDGEVIVGGLFTVVNGATRRRVARLHADGTLDGSFNVGLGLSSARRYPPEPDVEARAVVLQPDGRVLVGGDFSYVNGVQRQGLARLHHDGALDYDFDVYDSGISFVSALAIQPDGKALAGGAFYSINAVHNGGLVRVYSTGNDFPGRFEFGAAVWRTNEGAGAITLTVKRTGGSVGSATVRYSTSDSTAHSPADYSAQFETLSFGPGEVEKTITLPIVDDSEAEDEGCCSRWIDGTIGAEIDEEVFTLGLDFATGAVIGGQRYALVVIQDNDTAFAFDSASYSVGELDGRALMRIRRLGQTDGTNAVTWSASDGTARAGADYVTVSNTLIFLPGETRKDIGLTILEDELTEGNETVRLSLSGPTGGATLANPATTQLAIEDKPGAVVSTLPGSVDTSFFPGSWIDGVVDDFTLGSDGRIFARGYFYLSGGGGDVRYLAWLHPDGSLDESFRPPPDLYASALAVQPDGRVLVATQYFGGRVLRLEASGSMDTTFGPALYEGGSVQSIARQADGKLVIAGSFTNVNGVARRRIARLNENGTLDTGFDAGAGPDEAFIPWPGWLAVAFQDDGKILVAGDYRTWNGAAHSGLVRLNSNGMLDADFVPAISNSVYSFAVQSDNRIIVPRYSLNPNSDPTAGLVRLNADGSLDPTFTSTDLGDNGISVMALQDDGKVVISYRGSDSFNHVIGRLNVDGSLDVTFHAGTGADDYVNAIVVQHDGGVLIGGEFNHVNGRLRRGIARLIGGDPPHTPPSIKRQPASYTVMQGADVLFNVAVSAFPLPTFQWTFNGQPLTGATSSNLSLVNVSPAHAGTYAVRVSNELGGVTSSNALLTVLPAPTQAGAVDLGFRGSSELTGWQGYDFSAVKTLALQPDGKAIIGGVFTRPHRSDLEGLARLHSDGSLDASFDRGTGVSGNISALAVQPDGRILIAGYFFEVNGTRTANIARLRTDGTLDSSFRPQGYASYYIEDMVVQADGKIVIVGPFTSFADVPRNGVARLHADGSLDTNFIADTSVPGGSSWVALQSDGKVLVGGSFVFDGTAHQSKIVRLNEDGSLDPGFNPSAAAQGRVRHAVVQPDGKILVAGFFDQVNEVTRHAVARLNVDGSLDSSFDPGLGTGGTVQRLALQGDGRVLIAGDFTNFNGVVRSRIARLLANGTMDATFDPSGGASDTVSAMMMQSDGGVLIGGSFTNVDARPRLGIARLLNDPIVAAGALEFSIANPSVSESPGITIPLRVRRVGGTRGVVTVNYAVSGGSATDGTDFSFASGTLTFADGDTTEKTIETTVFNDEAAEGDETIQVWLANPLGGATLGAQAAAEITILEDDTAVEWTLTEYEANEGARSLPVQVRRRGRSTGTFTVHFATSNGTAQASSDYIGQDCTLTFAPGETNQTVLLVLLDDGVAETDETFHLWLSNPAGAMLGSNTTATVTLRDNDRPGTVDTTFEPDAALALAYDFAGPEGARALAIQPDGRVLVAGAFRSVAGFESFGIARLEPDGALDFSFLPGGWKDGVTAVNDATLLALQPDGKVLVVRRYVTPALLRLNDDGFVDESFAPPAFSPGSINALLIQPDGKILLGGIFEIGNGTPGYSLARLRRDGSLDATFDPGSGVAFAWPGKESYPGTVNALALQPDGRILVGGRFTSVNGAPRNALARLTPSGAVDTTFDPGAGLEIAFAGPGSASAAVLALQPDGRMLVAGCFTHVNGVARTNLARLQANGSVDVGFETPGLPCSFGSFGINSSIRALAVQPNGRILIGGAFCGWEDCTNLLRLHSDGSVDEDFSIIRQPRWYSFQNPPPFSVIAIGLQSDGQVLIGGSFDRIDRMALPGLARINGGVFHFEFHSVTRLAGGRARLTFAMPRGQSHLLQSSSDLMHWTDLNLARPLRDQTEFTDPAAGGADKRFYRARLFP